MQLLISNSFDPYFNIATEEFLLKNTNENILFLYQNQSCVVVGKHQNALAEINFRFVQENNIPVIRRISGGGTVYHDEGNINFTFLQNGEEGNLVNFKAFITPIADFLKQLGVPVDIGLRNDILINGLKVSGNAEHIFKKRTLHHGTLLFSSTLTDLRNALHIDTPKYFDKAVKSVRSKVTNIKESIPEELNTQQFFDSLASYLIDHYKTSPFLFTDDAISQIKSSAETKYSDWQWNYGYSPNYTFKNTVNLDSISLSIELQVEKGIIKNAIIEGNIDNSMIMDLNKSLVDQPHSFTSLSSNHSIIKLESRANTGSSEILWSFF